MAQQQPFIWKNNAPVTPQEVQRQRLIAAALLDPQAKPKNWAEGLASVTGALASNSLNDQAATAEAEGQAQAAGLFQGLNSGSDQSAIIAALNSPWANDNQGMVGQALLGSQLKQEDPMYQAQLANALTGGAGQETFFGTPLFTQDAEGNLIANQIGNQGSLNPVQLPEGQTIAPPTKEVDTGTEIITFDRFGNELFRTPKQNVEAERQKAYGSGLGTTDAANVAAYDSIKSKMPGLRENMVRLGQLAKKATYTQTGQLIDSIIRESGQVPSENAIARSDYIATVDNQVLPLLRDTFGAAFTQKEGDTLRNTLGDPNKSPVEKQAVLDAFIAQKERDLEAMQSRLPADAAPATGGGWEDLGNNIRIRSLGN